MGGERPIHVPNNTFCLFNITMDTIVFDKGYSLISYVRQQLIRLYILLGSI